MIKAMAIAFAVFSASVPRLLAEQSAPDKEWGMDESISYALEHNQGLKIAGKRVELAKADWIKAKTIPANPAIEGETASDSRYANEGEKRTRLGLTQEVEVFGQRWARKAAAQYRWEAAQAEYERGRKALAAQMREVFLSQLFLQKRRETLEAVSGLDKEIWDTAQKRFDEGAIRQINFDLTRIEYNRARALYLKADSAWTANRLRLNRLLGLPDPAVIVKLKGDLEFPPLKLSLEQLVQLALEHRGDYQAAKLEAKASLKDLSLARRTRFPNPKLGIFFEDDTSELAGLRGRDKLLGFSLALPLPLLNRNQGELARAGGAKDLADLAQVNTELDVRAQAIQTYRQFKNAEEILNVYADLEIRLDKDLELVRNAYLQGQVSIENYFMQKDRFLQARLDYLDNYTDYAQTRSALEQAAGLKWEELVSISEGEK